MAEKGQIENLGNIISFINISKNVIGRRVYRKTNVVAENLNQNVEIIVNDGEMIRD